MPSNIIADAKYKAQQLENFDYRKGPNTQGVDVGGVANEETAAAMEFLHKFRKLPLDKMSEEDIGESVASLLEQNGFKLNDEIPIL